MHNYNHNTLKRRQTTMPCMAAICILSGILLLGHNAGWISDYWHRIIFSWQMLLVLLGVSRILHWKIGQGIALLAMAAFFLIPYFMGETNITSLRNWPEHFWHYWPVFLIIYGTGMLIDCVFMPKIHHRSHDKYNSTENVREEEGYVQAVSRFNYLRYKVKASIFKGAYIEVSFGSLILDLRHTRLDAPETYIDLSNSFGGIEIYVPSCWNVVNSTNTSLGGLDDKRFVSNEIDYVHKLTIRGNNSFGGIEIKS